MDLVLHIIRRRNQPRQKQQFPHRQAHGSPMVKERVFFLMFIQIDFGVILLCVFCFEIVPNLGTSSLPITHTTTSAASTASHTKTTNTIHSLHDVTSGCSRTIPISWNNSSLLQVCYGKRETNQNCVRF